MIGCVFSFCRCCERCRPVVTCGWMRRTHARFCLLVICLILSIGECSSWRSIASNLSAELYIVSICKLSVSVSLIIFSGSSACSAVHLLCHLSITVFQRAWRSLPAHFSPVDVPVILSCCVTHCRDHLPHRMWFQPILCWDWQRV